MGWLNVSEELIDKKRDSYPVVWVKDIRERNAMQKGRGEPKKARHGLQSLERG